MALSEPDETEGRRTRLSRRKSTVDDDATVVTTNNNTTTSTTAEDGAAATASGTTTMPISSVSATTTNTSNKNAAATTKHTKEVMMVQADITTHTVGEHVVATLQAQELDEHEGLDEASLREHEEVTKVKNVAFMELGYQ